MLAQEPITVWVNKDGERFIEEAPLCNPFEPPNAVFRQPEQVCFSIFDSSIIQYIVDYGFERPGPSAGKPASCAKIEKELQDEVSKGNVKISGSWDEIAKWMGAHPETLAATVDKYNVSCDQGHDELLVKDSKYLKPLRTPPYYAVKCDAGLLATFGGIKINHRMEVLDKNNKPIKGLYAVGTDTGGWSPDTYNARLPGTACGFAINSGRIAGDSVVQYIKTH